MANDNKRNQYKPALIAIGIIVLSVIVMIWLASMGKEPAKREPEIAALLVEVTRPEPAEDRFIVRAQGTVSARIQTNLVSEVSGQVIWVDPDFAAGGFFRAGQELLRIDPRDYETALLAAQADLAAAEASLAEEEARSAAAREDFRRLYGTSREPSALTLRLPQVERARAQVQAQKAAVARAERNLEKTRVRIPFDAIIAERNADLGQYLTVGTVIGRALGTESVEVRLPVSETDLAFLGIVPGADEAAIGRELRLYGSVAGQNRSWTARLVRSEGVIDRNTRLAYLVARVDDPYALDTDDPNALPLPIGTFVEAEIPGIPALGLTILPTEAIRDGSQVYLAGPDDKLEVVPVEVVRTTPRESYVRGPLDASSRVITTAIPAPVPGLKLNVRERDESDEPALRILPAGDEAGDLDEVIDESAHTGDLDDDPETGAGSEGSSGETE